MYKNLTKPNFLSYNILLYFWLCIIQLLIADLLIKAIKNLIKNMTVLFLRKSNWFNNKYVTFTEKSLHDFIIGDIIVYLTEIMFYLIKNHVCRLLSYNWSRRVKQIDAVSFHIREYAGCLLSLSRLAYIKKELIFL